MQPPAGVKLAACLVNVSCGRQQVLIERIARSALSVTSQMTSSTPLPVCDVTAARGLMKEHGLRVACTVLNMFSDKDYDRTVITVAAPLATLGASVIALYNTACDLLDLTHHRGGHPRLGAVDLVPVHPLTASTSLEECGDLARAVGRHVTETVPGAAGFWFGAADQPLRRSLPQRRRQLGWFQRCPVLGEVDVGTPDPRLGVTGFGAIPYMTNYNVTLDSTDIQLGQAVAAEIRGSAPEGLPGKIEIGCNIDILPEALSEQMTPVLGGFYTPPEAIERRVTSLAGAAGVGLTPGSKVIGFTPEGAAEAAWQALLEGEGEAWRRRRRENLM